MGKWQQLVEFTGEYLPGPWAVVRPTDTDRPVVFVGAEGGDENTAHLVMVQPTDGGVEIAGPRGPVWDDPVQEATARLVCGAPYMLALLAEWVDVAAAPLTNGHPSQLMLKQLTVRTTALLAGHVRVGYEPPTARETAARQDPPPPPPAPSLFDGVG